MGWLDRLIDYVTDRYAPEPALYLCLCRLCYQRKRRHQMLPGDIYCCKLCSAGAWPRPLFRHIDE